LGLNKKVNQLYDYFGLSLPLWMESRKTLLCFAFLDFIFIYIFLLKNILMNNQISNLNRSLLFIFIWGLLSYLNGRYSFFKKYKKIKTKLYKLFISSFIVFLLTYFLDKTLIIFFNDWVLIGRNNWILIFIFSYLIQSLKFLLKNSIKKDTCIYLVGDEMQIKLFKKYIHSVTELKNIVIKNFSNYEKDEYSFKTIILLGNNVENFYDHYSYLISEKSEIITASNWCEKNLQRIPNEYLSINDFDFNILFNRSQEINWRIKRLGDIFISLFLLVITSPLIIFFSILIKIEDKGPIFYSQIRTGLYGNKFNIIKLRSMIQNSEKEGAVWAKSKDPRVTKIGKFIRKTRIDELPQLWSVFIGDMSLIGPRPERPEIDKILIKKIRFYNYRNTIRPGLSGWAQVNYKYGASIMDSKNKFSYEVFYLRNFSLLLDLLIFLKTLKLILKMEGSDPKSHDS